METAKLKKFAQLARRTLLKQVSAKLDLVLVAESSARREHPVAVQKLEEAIKASGKEQVAGRVAYIWFNRFCALRFMDVNRYTRIGVVSPAEGQFQPELLAEAKMGHIDEEMVPEKIRQQIFALLDGKAPSRDPQGEAYRLLLVAACNFWNLSMPFLFQRIDDYTELLMPDDLLSESSILAFTRDAMTPDACADVEVIGWLYQFYISEKKDQVFADLKKNKKVTPDNIPAATQLFTPHWIVRYLVENSLGRLWLLNRPASKLVEQMDYYIKPAPAPDGKKQPETDFLKIISPEKIKICDPACGSGHMLTYAFDLLYAIYEEEGYEPSEIPEKILTHNLHGIEVDERAGELAAFALTMKARAKQRSFFNKGVKPNICVLENIHFDQAELNDYMEFIGRDLFTSPLQTTLRQFEEADNFGSLIRPDVTDVDGMLRILESKNVSGQLFISMTHQKVLQALHQADYLSPKYHVVVANPPYMGGKGMNGRMAAWAKDNYPSSKTDLFAMFIERNLDFAQKHGSVAMITMQSWMFLSSFEALRMRLLEQSTIISMAHLGSRAFDSIGGEVVSTTAFVLEKSFRPGYKGYYIRLVSENCEADKNNAILESIDNPGSERLYRASAHDFTKIPSSPLHYSASEDIRNCFIKFGSIKSLGGFKRGISTADNDRFLRYWHEISLSTKGVDWFPYNKGGGDKRWFGYQDYLINWKNDGQDLREFKKSYVRNSQYNFMPCVSYSSLSSGKPSFRLYEGHINDQAGNFIPLDSAATAINLAASLNSIPSVFLVQLLCPTLNILIDELNKIPFHEKIEGGKLAGRCVDISKSDWDASENSWNFTTLPLLNFEYPQPTLNEAYLKIRAYWHETVLEMQRLEEENNRIFIDAYGLQDELTPEVPLNEITLTCNPHYRYDGDKSDEELESLLLADSMRELVSYAVGCMFGRYALDKPGLILANQGETLTDFLKQVPERSFMPDADNAIPMMEGEWFADNVSIRFREFLRVAFGEEHFDANLVFVEQALGKDLRKYFAKDFYSDHVRRYKKRPIYWLFSSPKGSFQVLIYMHRYRPDTVSVVLNDYLREFRTKLTSHNSHLEAVSISVSASQAEKTKALKEIETITKMIAEMEEYERDVLYPLATQQVEIDLDDGVKVNYPKFGTALKKIVGLDAKED